MVMEIIVSVILLFVGIAVLVTIHVCIVGRAFGRNNGGIVVQSSSSRRPPSMSSDDIKRLPCFEFKMEEKGNDNNNNSSSSSSPVECAVCLENFKEGDQCRFLPNCNHSFHAQCIDSWLLKTAVCPICRTDASSQKSVGESSNLTEIGVELT
ncbi:E3 ubiquitin-protein ligase ATL4-like [Cornus florida]|uniref:E3 ubiquitin-protein ligase ATL4-like n=1 Tax=Cornus florida TaxID=4283 RepID=UPI002897324E|nr:E3 ubiquitin-protein ligase ATL4-like [Cornus florida]